MVSNLVEVVMQQLAEIGNQGELISKKEQGTLALELVNIVVGHMEMNPSSATMVNIFVIICLRIPGTNSFSSIHQKNMLPVAALDLTKKLQH